MWQLQQRALINNPAKTLRSIARSYNVSAATILGRLLDRDIAGFAAFQYLVHENRSDPAKAKHWF